MDPSVISAPQGGLIGWVTQYGNIIFFFAQLVYWLGILVLLGYAVAQFKRWVNYQLGTGRSGKLRTDAPAEKTETVSVEEFVD